VDVNWYATESLAHQRLAELRAFAARCRVAPAPPLAGRAPAALAPALRRLGHRVLGGLVAAQAVAWRRLG
jgi:hypothetical protein